jgi:periplasmic mercuric ion binding protein
MKTTLTAICSMIALAVTVQAAEVTTTLSDVHLCCQSCVKGVDSAVAKVDGITATCDREAGTVKLVGPDTATVQKAVDALTAAGYFGKSSEASIKVNAETGAKGQKVQSLEVEGVHLCCPKCVKAVNHALEDVPGVKGNTAAKGVKSFTVTGDFNDQDVFNALQKAGLTGQAGK